MKSVLINIFLKLASHSILIRRLYCSIKRAQSPEFMEQIEIRKHTSLFDFRTLSQPLRYHPLFYVEDCNYYGILYNLLKYADISLKDKALTPHEIYLEHGIYIGNLVREKLIDSSKISLTFSDYRRQYISKIINTPVIAVGPYIHYADSLLNEHKISIIKNELGRVLLVFPSHSIGAVGTEYSKSEFIQEINLRKKDFDTVLACLYWKDIENGDHQDYIDEGFKIVTAGHRDDIHFLSRLKSIILLSDMSMSNNTGTHIGYCIYLNVPHYIFKQKVEYVSKSASGNNLLAIHHQEDLTITKNKDNQLLYEAFSSFNRIIAKEQFELCNFMWGFDQVKCKEGVRTILLGQ